MHIFLVNDDGIGARGIMALYRAAVRHGHEVTMCAPRYQQSAASHRITLIDPLYVSEFPLDAPGCQGYAITGSPADCVRLGMQQLVKKPVDVLISGINDGHNAGTAAHYSGTVGAAMEGAFHHIPSIASSILEHATSEMFDHLAECTLQIAEKYAKTNPPRGTILNINAPCVAPEEIKGPVYAPLDAGYFIENYIKRSSPRAGEYYWLDHDSKMDQKFEGTDRERLKSGYMTFTLIGNYTSANLDTWNALGLE